MNKNYKYDYLFFTYLREKIGLKKYEDILEKNDIEPYNKENINERISPYFSFLNEGNTKTFSDEENKAFDEIFSNDLDILLNNKYLDAIKFIEETYSKYYFSNLKSKYKYFIPGNFEYMAPSDAITLGINYIKYNDSMDEEKEEIIVDIINEMQEELASEKQIKIAVLEFNEVALNQPFVRL